MNRLKITFRNILKHTLFVCFTAIINFNLSYAQVSSEPSYKENFNIYRVVAIKNTNNQITSISNAVEVEKPYALYAPNVFSPDGDGINDFFRIIGQGLTNFDVEVYNRWGQMVFKSVNMNDQWNGRFKGKNMPTGTYVYKVKSSDFGTDNEILKSGTISLIR